MASNEFLCDPNIKVKVEPDEVKISFDLANVKAEAQIKEEIDNDEDDDEVHIKEEENVKGKLSDEIETNPPIKPNVNLKVDQREDPAASADLEDGEVTGEEETVAAESGADAMPICRFYARNACTWGSSCRFRHPGDFHSNLGNYNMFDSKTAPSAQQCSSTQHPPPVDGSHILDQLAPQSTRADLYANWPSSEENDVLDTTWDRNLKSLQQILHIPTTNADAFHARLAPSLYPPLPLPLPSFLGLIDPYYVPARPALLPTPTLPVMTLRPPVASSTPYCRKVEQEHQHVEEQVEQRHAWSDPWTKVARGRSPHPPPSVTAGRYSTSSSSLERESSWECSSKRCQRRPRSRKRKRSPSPSEIQKRRRGPRTPSRVPYRRRGPHTPSYSPPSPRREAKSKNSSRQKRSTRFSSSSSYSDSSSDESSFSSNPSIDMRRQPRSKTRYRRAEVPQTPKKKPTKKRSERVESPGYSNRRREYLLMKLRLVEEEIAKKKKMMK